MNIKERLLPNKTPNMVRIGNSNIFIVRSQAGFNKAVKLFKDGEDYIDSTVFDYPTIYPALVSLSLGYRGYHYVNVNWIHLNEIKGVLKDMKEENVSDTIKQLMGCNGFILITAVDDDEKNAMAIATYRDEHKGPLTHWLLAALEKMEEGQIANEGQD